MDEMIEVINAAGKMTSLGASAVAPEVAEAVSSTLTTYFDMEQLAKTVGMALARATRAEAGLATASATAGIVTATAAAVTRGDVRKVGLLPQSIEPNQVVILRAHVVDFGASIEQMIRLGGGVPVEVGTVNKATIAQVEGAIAEATAAVMYVVSHHVNAEGSIDLGRVIEVAHKRGVPVIIDAAAEMDLTKFVEAGADLVIYSGQKAIGGPTSGVLVGRAGLIEAARAQTAGIGRAMKVSKEALVGLMVALRQYLAADHAAERRDQRHRMERLAEMLGEIPGGQVTIVGDETRPIPRVSLHLTDEAALSAPELIRVLEAGNPSIRTRNHHSGQGTILFDPRPLRAGDEEIIARTVRRALGLETYACPQAES